MFKLSQLLSYDNIVIQCHNNPDADALASGYALYYYFKEFKKNVRLIYAGPLAISKPNLVSMVDVLQIPIEFVKEIDKVDLLITVDCQYGAGNVDKLYADNIAIIDHHAQEVLGIELTEIRPYLSSCSTLVWDLLRDEGIDVNNNINISTALYYGLLSDTNNLVEISHPLDRDMRDILLFNDTLIKSLKSSNLSLNDLETAGIAILRYSHNDIDKFAIFKANPCDPNILGFISDLAIQVDSINTCVVHSELATEIKFSVRSCIKEVMANELAAFISEGIGSGGGHVDRAGGFISIKAFNNKFQNINVEAYLLNRIREYYDSFDIIYSNNYKIDLSCMNRYDKKRLPIGFIKSTDAYVEGTPILIRTLEGDINTYTHDESYIIIGRRGKVHSIEKEQFEKNYNPTQHNFNLASEYNPYVKNKVTGETIDLGTLAKSCIYKNKVYIYAKELTKNTKLFNKKNTDKYMSGKIGDYIAVNGYDTSDVFIIDKELFNLEYEGKEL